MPKPVAKAAPKNKPSDYLPYTGEKQWWVSEPDAVAPLQEAKTGPANYKQGVPLLTLPQLFQEAVKKNGGRPALRTEDMPPLAKGQTAPPALPLAQWKTWTWKTYYQDSRKVAKALMALGMNQFNTCTVFGFNAPQWHLSFWGAVLAGGKVAGIYPSDNEEQVKFKSNHSDAVVAVVETAVHLEKYKAVCSDLPMLKAIVTWGCEPGDDITADDGRIIKTMGWGEFLKLGSSDAIGEQELDDRTAKIHPGNCCALIYTSGTTGNPKAVMISHDNLTYCAMTVLKLPGNLGVKNEEERMVSYLPLSHIAGMAVDIIAPLGLSSNLFGFKGWCSTNFARNYDLKTGSLVDRLKAVRPTIFLGVPRVWEKIMEKLRAVGASTKGVKKMLSTFAKKKAAVFTSSRQLGGEGKTPMFMGVANFVLNKVKQKLGLDKGKFLFSGAAPMTRECTEYFGSLGINVNEVYGMSETTGVVTWSTDEYHTWGSVGFENKGVEVRVLKKGADVPTVVPDTKDLFKPSEENQGELCFRGRNIMMGYMANPKLGDAHVKQITEKNIDAIDKWGWLHSGDKGTRDIRGMFKITGRYKELIITAGGENIAPVPIEDEIKRLCPFLSNVMMIGNKRKFNVLLVTLRTVGSSGELPGTDELMVPASELSEARTVGEAMKDDVFIQTITKAIQATNANLNVVPSNAAKIQKFTILPRDFSVQTGEFTATLKLKRSVVDDVFKPIIDKMYESKDVYVNYTLAPTPDLNMGGGEYQNPDEKKLSFKFSNVVEEGKAQAQE